MAFKRTARLLCTLCTLLLCVSCGGSLVKIRYEDDYYVDSAHNIRYINASVSYEPIKVGAEYAQYGDLILYEIPGLPPEQWLTEAYDGIGSIFYAEDVPLPTLAEFDSSLIHICVSDINTIRIGSIEDKAEVTAIIDHFIQGEEVMPPVDYAQSFYLKIESDTWAEIRYSVLYIVGNDGRTYLYDRATRRGVEMGELLEKYLPRESSDSIA